LYLNESRAVPPKYCLRIFSPRISPPLPWAAEEEGLVKVFSALMLSFYDAADASAEKLIARRLPANRPKSHLATRAHPPPTNKIGTCCHSATKINGSVCQTGSFTFGPMEYLLCLLSASFVRPGIMMKTD
jgi:hypothetical protein